MHVCNLHFNIVCCDTTTIIFVFLFFFLLAPTHVYWKAFLSDMCPYVSVTHVRLDEGTKFTSALPDDDIEILGLPPICPSVFEPWKQKAGASFTNSIW